MQYPPMVTLIKVIKDLIENLSEGHKTLWLHTTIVMKMQEWVMLYHCNAGML